MVAHLFFFLSVYVCSQTPARPLGAFNSFFGGNIQPISRAELARRIRTSRIGRPGSIRP